MPTGVLWIGDLVEVDRANIDQLSNHFIGVGRYEKTFQATSGWHCGGRRDDDRRPGGRGHLLHDASFQGEEAGKQVTASAGVDSASRCPRPSAPFRTSAMPSVVTIMSQTNAKTVSRGNAP